MWGPHVGLIIIENGVRKDISHGRVEQEAPWWPFFDKIAPESRPILRHRLENTGAGRADEPAQR